MSTISSAPAASLGPVLRWLDGRTASVVRAANPQWPSAGMDIPSGILRVGMRAGGGGTNLTVSSATPLRIDLADEAVLAWRADRLEDCVVVDVWTSMLRHTLTTALGETDRTWPGVGALTALELGSAGRSRVAGTPW